VSGRLSVLLADENSSRHLPPVPAARRLTPATQGLNVSYVYC